MKPDTPMQREGLKKACDLVRACINEKGFLASPTRHDNYRRIWSRDGVIIGLAALMSEDVELVDAFGRTLDTLAEQQGPHGEIPSNVGVDNGDISYGGTAGRVDADLWFVIGVAEYWQKTRDRHFLKRMIPTLEKVLFLLGSWEFNNKGFLYVPATGDWADEYVHDGYVLYDQLLYLQALRSYQRLSADYRKRTDRDLVEKIERLQQMIQANFWFGHEDRIPEMVYHKILFEKGRAAAKQCTQQFWLPFFSPYGYGYRFDGFANVLASLLGVSNPERCETVDRYIDKIVGKDIKLLPAFHPVIKQEDKDWEELHVSFSYDFKNRPYEFHNGGLWPMLTGFYVADLARRGKRDMARGYMLGIDQANRMEMDGRAWGFPEYLNGASFTPGGNSCQCWSGSAALMAHYALEGKPLFSVDGNDIPVQ